MAVLPGALAIHSRRRGLLEIALERPGLIRRHPARRKALEAGVSALDPDRLYREHGERLFRYLVRLSGDPELAADVLQDTFLRLVERPPRRHDHLKAWLFRVATNRLRDLRRKSARRSGLMHEDVVLGALADPPPSPDREVERAESQSIVRRALGVLSARDQAILLMREEGFAHREIAEAVGTTTGSVGTLIARALDKLARALESMPDTTNPREAGSS
jgi:RNA polymerase sigma-70 factor (ECF subfamily)